MRALSPVELEEIFAIRAELESFAAARGAAQVADDPALLARLETLLDELDHVGQQAEEWRSGNEEFHTSIYQVAGMPRLESLIASLWVAVGPYLRLYVGSPQNLVESQETAPRDTRRAPPGDADGAAGAMKVHLAAALAALLGGLEGAGAT